MLALLRALRALAVSAIVPALVLTIATDASDGPWRAAELVALVAHFWLLFAIVLGAPFLAYAAVSRMRRREPSAAGCVAVAAATLFALFWYERLKPLELWTVRYRPAPDDLIALAVIVLLTSALALAIAAGRASVGSRALRSIAAIVACSAALGAYARAFDRPPDRTESARRLSQNSGSTGSGSTPRPRVLFVGVDGLDWNAVDRLIGERRLPQIGELLEHGRSFELDTGDLSLSPEIWTAIYSGRIPRFSGYVTWDFLGLSRPVDALPASGHRPIWGVNKWLWRTTALGLWTPASVTTARFTGPAFWRVASAAGRTVAVFEPVPYQVLGEEVNGAFAWQRDDDCDVHWKIAGRTPWTDHVPFPGRLRETAAEAIDVERRRAALVGDLFARAQPALGVYYTPLVDETSHWEWPSAQPRGSAAALDDRFDRSVIATAYEQVDRSIGLLRERFGAPQIVVLVSDHGWEFSPYQHSRVPHGMVIVSDTRLSGFGGTIAVTAVAPTVLSLLGLPRDAAGAPGIADVPSAGVAGYDGVRPLFLDSESERADDGARQRLKSLGYVGR